ncbi:MAG: nicotinate-nucleotide adenylyltransferase [Sphingomonadaceae bacterium]
MAGARERPDPSVSVGRSVISVRSRRVGLLGGSFNPAHGGHRRISIDAMAALGLDELWWLVSPGNPLKPRAGMAPIEARMRSARKQARRAPIRVSALEQALGTRYTIDTLRKLQHRYPKIHFVWLMGADNLAGFHHWKQWRDIACRIPIAVIARPGYDAAAIASPAMAWLRRYRVSAASFRSEAGWRAPALVILRFDPDPRSATAIRRSYPEWADALSGRPMRDMVTHRMIAPERLKPVA